MLAFDLVGYSTNSLDSSTKHKLVLLFFSLLSSLNEELLAVAVRSIVDAAVLI